MTAYRELIDTYGRSTADVFGTLDEFRLKLDDCIAEARNAVRAEILGDDLNPSVLVLYARAYRDLRDGIMATMTDPDRWDGDESEDTILLRYVQWLAAGRLAEDGEPVLVSSVPDGVPVGSMEYRVARDEKTWAPIATEEAARDMVVTYARHFPEPRPYAEQRTVRTWPDGSVLYGPWARLEDEA
jgi:hypothetical protein